SLKYFSLASPVTSVAPSPSYWSLPWWRPLAREKETVRPYADRRRQRALPQVMSEPLFSGFLSRERRRANRSNQPLALLIISAEDAPQARFFSRWAEVVDALAAAKRQSDVIGWLEINGVLGLLLADASVTGSTLARDIAVRVRAELAKRLGTK